MVSIEFKNANQVYRQLENLTKGLTGPSVLNEIRPKLERDFNAANKELFSGEGASGAHGKWKPLSPRYKAWKSKKYPGKKKMVLTGRLKKALTTNKGDLGYIASRYPGKMIFTWLIQIPYWIYHQKGSAPLPMRKTFDPNSKVLKRFLSAIYAAQLRFIRDTKVFDKVSIRRPSWDKIELE